MIISLFSGTAAYLSPQPALRHLSSLTPRVYHTGNGNQKSATPSLVVVRVPSVLFAEIGEEIAFFEYRAEEEASDPASLLCLQHGWNQRTAAASAQPVIQR